MAEKQQSNPRFAVCVQNEGYEASLERNKLYVVLPDPDAEREADVRVVDESGEDYLYPADWFVALEVPKAVKDSLLKLSPGRGRIPRSGLRIRIEEAREDGLVSAHPGFVELIRKSRETCPPGSGIPLEEIEQELGETASRPRARRRSARCRPR
jgi:hypothetical protein